MAKITNTRINSIKANFETGDEPDQAEYHDLITAIQEAAQDHEHTDSGGPGSGTGDAAVIGHLRHGTDANKPASPAAGDVYIADDTSKVYVCYSAGTWSEVGGAPADTIAMLGPGSIEVFDTTSTFLAANGAFFQPFWVPRTITVNKIRVVIAISSGNIDVGIYNAAGTRLVSTGSIPSPGSGKRDISITDTQLTPGWYYLAIAADNTTLSLCRATITAQLQVGESATSAFPLPATKPSTAYASRVYAMWAIVQGESGW